MEKGRDVNDIGCLEAVACLGCFRSQVATCAMHGQTGEGRSGWTEVYQQRAHVRQRLQACHMRCTQALPR